MVHKSYEKNNKYWIQVDGTQELREKQQVLNTSWWYTRATRKTTSIEYKLAKDNDGARVLQRVSTGQMWQSGEKYSMK